jgi:hypothetical protein
MDLLHAMIEAFGASAEWKFGMHSLSVGTAQGQ